MKTLEELKALGEAPEFLKDEGYTTLTKGYLLENETPKDMYTRLARNSANILKKPEMESKIFDVLWKGWLTPSTPVYCNFGTSRGLPIACYSTSVSDNTSDIFDKIKETAILSKNGGGTGKYFGNIRETGSPISSGGVSGGVIPWIKIEDSTINAVSQNGIRRGSEAFYLPMSHGDIEEFIDIRRQTGDVSRRCLGIGSHHGVCIDDEFMKKAVNGKGKERNLLTKVITTRVETGEPYIFFTDNVNKANPAMYKDRGMIVTHSNLCNEITLYSDSKNTFVCCLSSVNLSKYDEWKDTDLIEIAIYFLDSVMEEFIVKASTMEGMENSVNFAKKSRALGLGVVGWHTLLQEKMIPFESFQAMTLNNEIFSYLSIQARNASQKLALEYGEPELCKGYGVRNTHLLALAPTTSNALIAGGVSQSIEPITANILVQKSAKGTFIRKNPTLERLLESKGINTYDVWMKINSEKGSVKSVVGLTDEEKSVFLTAREMNQLTLIRQAGQRQKYIDQGQSINLFFSVPVSVTPEESKLLGKYLWDVHVEAWKLGLKGLYYLKSESVLGFDSGLTNNCLACEA